MTEEQSNAGADQAAGTTNPAVHGRFDGVVYDAASNTNRDAIMDSVLDLEKSIMALPDGRSRAFALGKLEECHLWTGKAIRDAQWARATH